MSVIFAPGSLKPEFCFGEQVFHWTERDGVWKAASGGKIGRLAPRGKGWELICPSEDDGYWANYFDLNRDYAEVAALGEKYPTLGRAVALLPGLRVLNQPVWEALMAFIISANNNTGRIRKIVLALSETLGERLDEEAYSFPTPAALARADEALLTGLGCGYRAPYLIKTARMIEDGFPLDSLADMPYDEAHKLLLTLMGVGDKVADCVQLFGLGQSRAFPVDVWVERLMRAWFVPGVSGRKMCAQAGYELFGELAGLAQQYLYHCARAGLIPMEGGAA